MESKKISVGDYVLATSYSDGDPFNPWAIGIFSGMLEKYKPEDRYLIVDDNNVPFRRNGFRRVIKISARRGSWLLSHKSEIERGSRSLFWWLRQPMIGTKMNGSILKGN